jgi:hypothetical protein
MARSQQRLYVYKVVADTGGAPCVSERVLSLALCKPKIRSAAREGDIVFGFGGKDYGERLIYIAEITGKPPVGEYYRDPCFTKRPDCIYEDNDGVPERKRSARHHFLTDERKRDVGMKFENAYVLLSENFRYFGGNGTYSYKQEFPSVKILIEGLKRGHRVNHTSQLRSELMALKDQAWSQHNKMVLGSPTDRDRRQVCNRETPSVEC